MINARRHDDRHLGTVGRETASGGRGMLRRTASVINGFDAWSCFPLQIGEWR